MKTIFTILGVILLSSFQRVSSDGITVELQNNCGRKIDLQVELVHNKLSMSMDNGVKNKFRIKVGSEIIVNHTTIYQVVQTDEGKLIRLCK
jgi:hypothetical protein